jgi:ketosteroid isomerase-like protein
MTETASLSDEVTVAELDRRFQAAVKTNDKKTIDAILADDYILILGNGRTESKAEAMRHAREGLTIYELQDESEKSVRVTGNTAVVTAKLRIKGQREGHPIDYTLWYSDTYVRRGDVWKYWVGQSSLPLPQDEEVTATCQRHD